MKRRDQIIELYNQGKTRMEICQILQCGKSIVSYHLTPGQKEKYATRCKKYYKPKQRKIVEKTPKIKNKCCNCGTETKNKKFCSIKCCGIHKKLDETELKLVSNCFYCEVPLTRENAYKCKAVIQNICKVCSAKQQNIRKYNFKKCCVEYKGGCCTRCGYNKNMSALQFHHTNPTQKDFNIAKCTKFKFDDTVKQELDKCILLCANCHFEEHNSDYGNTKLPKQTIALTAIYEK